MFSIIWRIRDVIYCSLRGLPPAFVFLIPAILLKYSGPRLAVFMPPLCPNRAAGGLAIRCSMTLIAASRSSCTRLDRPCGSSAGEVVSTVSASVMRFRNAWTSVLSDGFFGITLTVAGRRIRKQPLAVLFARPQGHYPAGELGAILPVLIQRLSGGIRNRDGRLPDASGFGGVEPEARAGCQIEAVV